MKYRLSLPFAGILTVLTILAGFLGDGGPAWPK